MDCLSAGGLTIWPDPRAADAAHIDDVRDLSYVCLNHDIVEIFARFGDDGDVVLGAFGRYTWLGGRRTRVEIGAVVRWWVSDGALGLCESAATRRSLWGVIGS